MTTIELNDFENVHTRLQAFFLALRDMTDRHTRALKTPIFDLDETGQQAIVDKLNPYASFELSQASELKGSRLEATGSGMMFVSAIDGVVMGAEVISHGDIVTGQLDDACVLPVPTVECLLLSDELETPIIDQTLSGVILLKDAVYKTGLNQSGDFEVEYNLGDLQIGLPLSHYLNIRIVDN